MLFPSDSIDLLRLDFLFDAGTSRQPLPLCASATSTLCISASKHYDATQVAEFLDAHGILLDSSADVNSADIAVVLQPRHASAFLPILHDLLISPTFPETEFDAFRRRSRQRLVTNYQRTGYVARNLFCKTLFGSDRAEGRFAVPEDVDRLSLDVIRSFFADWFSLKGVFLSVSGKYDGAILDDLKSLFGDPSETNARLIRECSQSSPVLPHRRQVIHHTLQHDGPQATIHLGCMLPFTTDSDAFAEFSVLNTVLGGYFGSRLMRNVREEKGYTYGIYSHIRVVQGCASFEIVSDVAAIHTDDALYEIYNEMDNLCQSSVPTDELELVRRYMEGDYLRSIDGVFERAERYVHMAVCGLDDDLFSARQLQAIRSVTPARLTELAQQVFQKDMITEVVVH